ncbi:hypothetical protein AVEN_271412-1 [Araneus ventricosus]|uniref:Uncharacterized protein n=1 Tax=Araneus ventricosus TaxID=182803 RepID=A0A4Y2H3F0_ARAVE|nr:hypothetical protein AVEN_271412-1 [Araneus ventricosus]
MTGFRYFENFRRLNDPAVGFNQWLMNFKGLGEEAFGVAWAERDFWRKTNGEDDEEKLVKKMQDVEDKKFGRPWSLRAFHGQHREDVLTPRKILLVISYKFISMENDPSISLR